MDEANFEHMSRLDIGVTLYSQTILGLFIRKLIGLNNLTYE